MLREYQNGEIVPQGDERKVLARFYKHAVKNEHQSTLSGRPVFDEQTWVSIIVPGDKNTKVERKMREEDKFRFPLAWKRYEDNATPSAIGTPIEEWPRVSVSQAAELKALNITTVEHISELSDVICQKMMGLDQLRTQAKAFIAQAKDQAYAQQLASELEKRDEEIASLKSTLATLSAKLDSLLPKQEKKERSAA